MSGRDEWRVLLIDDEEDIRDVMSISLRDAGYEVATAGDGRTGLALLADLDPRIVITDLRMPQMSGLEVLERIKATRPETEVIVVTAFGEMDVAIRALRLDASDFITKPVSEEALHMALARARERWAGRRQLADYAALLEEENVQTTQELLETISFQRRLIDGSMDGILGLDRDEKVIIFNHALEKMLGISRYRALGRLSFQDFLAGARGRELKAALEADRAGGPGRLWLFETEMAAPGGKPIPVQVSATVILEGDRPDGLVLFIRDLRELRRLEREMTDQAKILHQDKMMALGRLSASVVHEINNPLAGVLNYARLMKRILERSGLNQEKTDKFKSYLELMESETDRCSRIVSNLLSFSRRSEPEYAQVDLGDLLERSILLCRHKLDLSNIELTVDISAGLPPARGDRNQLQQCLINLIFNAVDAMPHGGRLTLSAFADRTPGRVAVAVADTGHGIPAGEIPHIFEPFFTTKQEGAGVGLGLSTVYGLVERHGGAIQVESRPEFGTIFTIFLPI